MFASLHVEMRIRENFSARTSENDALASVPQADPEAVPQAATMLRYQKFAGPHKLTTSYITDPYTLLIHYKRAFKVLDLLKRGTKLPSADQLGGAALANELVRRKGQAGTKLGGGTGSSNAYNPTWESDGSSDPKKSILILGNRTNFQVNWLLGPGEAKATGGATGAHGGTDLDSKGIAYDTTSRPHALAGRAGMSVHAPSTAGGLWRTHYDQSLAASQYEQELLGERAGYRGGVLGSRRLTTRGQHFGASDSGLGGGGPSFAVRGKKGGSPRVQMNPGTSMTEELTTQTVEEAPMHHSLILCLDPIIYAKALYRVKLPVMMVASPHELEVHPELLHITDYLLPAIGGRHDRALCEVVRREIVG